MSKAAGQARQAEATLQVELGIDSLERRFYRPRFAFAFPLRSWILAAEIDYSQRINGRLQGAIDYWLDMALQKQIKGRILGEVRLNHLCRHLTSRYQSRVLDLNEVLGKVWCRGDNFRAAVGAGFYIGGNIGYRSLITWDLDIPRILNTDLGFSGSFTWSDFQDLYHQIELFIPLNPGTELFVRQARHYRFPDTTYIGVRVKSDGATEKYLRGFNILIGAFPAYDIYKVAVCGDIKLDFFQKDNRRVITELDFTGPVLAGKGFFGSFWPDHMGYLIGLQYEKKLGPGRYLVWYSKYAVDMPCDKDEPFAADLGTGIAFRNQPDFERIADPLRFEFMAGVNFKHDYDLIAKLGVNSRPRGRRAVLGVNGYVRSNNEKTTVEMRAFVELNRRLSIRPFIGLDRLALFSGERLSWSKWMFGVELFNWSR